MTADKEQRRSRSRGEVPSIDGSTELRDPSFEAQESVVYRLFSKFEKRFETQWQDSTAELKSTVMELDTIQRERMLLSLQSAQDAIDGAFKEVVENEHYNVSASGKGLARQWTVEFTGPVATAARRAQKALQAQRMATGTWRRVDALTPDGAYEQVCISADASPQQLRVEQAGRRIAKALRDRFPIAARARLLRREVVMAVEWHCAVHVTATRRDEDVVVEWNAGALRQLGVSLEDAKHAIDETDPARASASVNWCL